MASHGNEHGNGHGGGGHHIISQGKLFLTFGALIVFMVLTIAAAFALPEGIRDNTRIMNVIALGIATVKAGLVITIFMGVGHGTRLIKLFAWGGFAWFTLLFIMFADYMTRPNEPVVGWEQEVPSAMPRNTVKNPD